MPICYDKAGQPYFLPPPASCPSTPIPGIAPGLPFAGLPAGTGFGQAGSPAAQQVSSAITNATGSATSNALSGIIPDNLKNPTTWKRIALVGAAVLLVVMGGVLIIAKPAEKVSTTAGKVIA